MRELLESKNNGSFLRLHFHEAVSFIKSHRRHKTRINRFSINFRSYGFLLLLRKSGRGKRLLVLVTMLWFSLTASKIPKVNKLIEKRRVSGIK